MWKLRDGGCHGCALALALAVSGCGGSDDGDGEKAGNDCGSLDAPLPLTLTGVTPAAGSTVTNSAIAHSYTITGLHALIDPNFAMSATHTAGQPIPAELVITPTQTGQNDIRYDLAPLSWTTAPGTVDIIDLAVYQTDDGCFYSFPTPVFSYAITP